MPGKNIVLPKLTQKYKVLIVAASIGGGHIQAGRAVEAALAAAYANDVETIFVDFSSAQASRLSRWIKSTYLFTLDVFPAVYDFLYRRAQNQFPGSLLCGLTARAMHSTLWSLIRRHQPDLILCTHPFPCAAANELQRRGQLSVPVVAVITDFTVHRLWVYAAVARYCVAAPPLQTLLENFSVPADRIAVTGIPIQSDFGTFLSRQDARAQLALPERFTVLLMGGSLGLDTLRTALQELSQLTLPLNIIAVAGNNEPLRLQLEKLATASAQHIRVLGYTQEVPLLMSAADLLISKPGALTISEALVKGLPLVLYQALPGQEEDNAAYLATQGAALWIKSESLLAGELTRLFNQPDELAQLGKRALALGRPQAAAQVAECVYQLLSSSPP